MKLTEFLEGLTTSKRKDGYVTSSDIYAIWDEAREKAEKITGEKIPKNLVLITGLPLLEDLKQIVEAGVFEDVMVSIPGTKVPIPGVVLRDKSGLGVGFRNGGWIRTTFRDKKWIGTGCEGELLVEHMMDEDGTVVIKYFGERPVKFFNVSGAPYPDKKESGKDASRS